ncbi:AAA family ATPase [Novosphingobium album (ex Liu et al. 2023)]|uniref:AAA family ATPase n=1 Tax=Novosphingobium album (ex Liu et al. 2023) TaxID=3031130 RepID=A0ABT5WUF4_9SPHN|nr:AAA family ATPase [Novosphingobium album (ex Liu et al. 2023)]MDE8653538.1 AAA family ATPase [Novosphingobium album (ex Liu et al. 2023)]
MTDQSKIPVPRKQGAPDGAPRGDSLIERAAGQFDLNRFIAPPIPGDLIPPPRKGPARPQARVAPEPAARPQPAVPDQVVANPIRPDPVPVAQAAPAPVEPAPQAAATPAPAAPEPVRFGGKHHPIDRDHLREQGLIVPEGSVTALLEEFRIVKRQLLVHAADLRRHNAGGAAQRILVSSPHPGEGKTYCAVNLALSIAAEKESEVLLVDADFAKPSVLSALGLPGGPGLMDGLMDETADVADFVIGTDIPGLWVLPAGDATTNDSEYLNSSRTARVLDRLTQGAPHRIVIFDSPPALAASPAAELAKYVGQVVIVVRADRTGQGALEDAISLLGACPNIQLLLNATQFSPSGRRFGTYYGYRG